MPIEKPIVYPEVNLPFFLTRGSDGRLVADKDFLKEGSLGPFDRVIDFGSSRDSIREEVPPENRITANLWPELTYLGFDIPIVASRMRDICRLANDPNRSFNNPADREEYRSHLKIVYKELARSVAGRIDPQSALITPPKNGGIFVQEVYQEIGFPAENFLDYRMSRLLGKDGRLMVGVRLADKNPKISAFRNFVFADDCLASVISAWGTCEMIKEELEKESALSEARVIIAVSAATQRGLTSLLSIESRRHFGFGRMEAVAAVPVYRLSEDYYLLEDNGNYTVGDMGKWSLPPEAKRG